MVASAFCRTTASEMAIWLWKNDSRTARAYVMILLS